MANRDESLLSKVESNLELAKLQKVNTPQAWELISTPKLDQKRVWPHRSKLVILTTIFSFVGDHPWISLAIVSIGAGIFMLNYET